ncbi:CmpA/NrtA family ABC transporter substrate-binding protein [Devosia sp. ZB163]|uniref:CmpA/NrtA family ABC transporter substrate-binding protein n=1 Tax=Devosia sp. ZB163 TaxID=3025938 RepID=UPI00235F84CC|nr:CmpA/NrtA family ABC transporter substrate-binding protein [Devosia sp. ZB163]MDC9825244.1 CmpA/NrtA family ABC transporter substrate-binding protein [Devosia sp. ZB163]
MSLTPLTAGFLPLFDSVLLVLAREKGFAANEGMDLLLMRETSWANIRDRAALGHFDFAQMLAPMPIAATLGLNPLSAPMIAPMTLGLGGNGVTVSADLWARMAEAGAPATLEAGPVGAALAKVVRSHERKLRFGVVHQTSPHNYELRYWLSASGIVPDRDVEIVVLPPPYLPDALGAGGIDGYCVGEPWNTVGVKREGGHIATVKAAIWRNSPDKVIGMRAAWAEANSELVAGLIRAVHHAARWCGEPANHAEAAAILSAPQYLDLPGEVISPSLTGRFDVGAGVAVTVPNSFVPYAGAANFPWTSQALWFYSQMVRWGEVEHSADRARAAAATFRPDVYRSALVPLGVPTPVADSKIEGLLAEPTEVAATGGTLVIGPDGFFDGQVFDPAALDAYIAAQRR